MALNSLKFLFFVRPQYGFKELELYVNFNLYLSFNASCVSCFIAYHTRLLYISYGKTFYDCVSSFQL